MAQPLKSRRGCTDWSPSGPLLERAPEFGKPAPARARRAPELRHAAWDVPPLTAYLVALLDTGHYLPLHRTRQGKSQRPPFFAAGTRRGIGESRRDKPPASPPARDKRGRLSLRAPHTVPRGWSCI